MRNIVTVIPNFITPQECAELNMWVEKATELKWMDYGITTDRTVYKNRVTTRFYGNRFEKYPDLAYDIYKRIPIALNMPDLPISTNTSGKHGIVVNNTFPGGDVYEHLDPKEGELELLRCNIITQMPETGGELTVANKVYDVKCGDLHCYLPSKHRHKVGTVFGNHSRILWMFGFKISDKDWENEC